MTVTKTTTPAGVGSVSGSAQTERDPGLGAPVDDAARSDEDDKRLGGPIANGASDKNAHQRRTGGSANDPHGGYEQDAPRFETGSDPEPLDELARVNFEAKREDGKDRGASDLRGGDQPVMRSESEIRIKNEVLESRRKI